MLRCAYTLASRRIMWFGHVLLAAPYSRSSMAATTLTASVGRRGICLSFLAILQLTMFG